MSTSVNLKQKALVAIFVLGIAAVAPLVSAGDDVALDGYCPVAYAAMGKAVKGKAKFAVEHDGETYYMANGKAKTMFEQSPDKYAVAYDGWCATGVAHGMQVASDPGVVLVRDGKTYLFSNDEARAMFEKDAAKTVMMADENWPKVEHQGHGH